MKEILRNSIGIGLIVGVFVSLVNFFVILLIGFATEDLNISMILLATLITFLIFFIPTFIISFSVSIIYRHFFE